MVVRRSMIGVECVTAGMGFLIGQGVESILNLPTPLHDVIPFVPIGQRSKTEPKSKRRRKNGALCCSSLLFLPTDTYRSSSMLLRQASLSVARYSKKCSSRSMSATAKVWIDENTRVICQGFTGKQVCVCVCTNAQNMFLVSLYSYNNVYII